MSGYLRFQPRDCSPETLARVKALSESVRASAEKYKDHIRPLLDAGLTRAEVCQAMTGAPPVDGPCRISPKDRDYPEQVIRVVVCIAIDEVLEERNTEGDGATPEH